MLLRFGVSNHSSIRDYREIFLSASRRIKRKGLTIPVPTLKEEAVPIVALYGSNATGKSNLIDAIANMRQLIVSSHKFFGATDKLPRNPFRLNDQCGKEPTRFDCTFTIGQDISDERSLYTTESLYEYGFEYVDTEIQHEWLYRVVRKERQSTQLLFERKAENGSVCVTFGSQLRGENKTIANLTRSNSLFLSAGAQNNHALLTEMYRYFAEHVTVTSYSRALGDYLAPKSLSNFNHMERLKLLVRQADIGIVDVEIDAEDEEVKEERAGLVRDLTGLILRHSEPFEEKDQIEVESHFDELLHSQRLRLTHSGAGGRTEAFDYALESKGTKTLISMLVPALEALAEGSLLVVDEIDTSLHPNLARALVSLFVNKESNTRGAQLIFSTHDVTLLNCGILHPDEIWVTDKSGEGATQFTPLTEFKLRSRDDIEKAYRHGRFGGVPVSDEFHLENCRDMVSANS